MRTAELIAKTESESLKTEAVRTNESNSEIDKFVMPRVARHQEC